MSFPALALFDLDGTLLDSAPDFVATLNHMLAERGEQPMPLDALRPHVSKGARAMLDDARFVDHLAQHFFGQDVDLRYLVRSAEPIEEMQKRNPRFERGGVRN